MAQRALTAGMTVPRRRVLFNLLDADGWAWALLKALFWLSVLIMTLGYLPDRAYYFTVGRTVELGVLAWSPINLCPPSNQTLPCPAPVGAIVPWEASPAELSLPAPRTDGSVVQVGTQVLYIGGSDGTTAQSTVYVAKAVGTGNFDAWVDGPALPAPRSDAAVAYVAGKIYLIGGFDETGAPTTTTFVLSPDGTTGELGEWTEETEKLVLPEARAGAAAVATADGLLVIGGSNADGPTATTWKALLDAQGLLGTWEVQAPLAQPQAGGAAAVAGDYVWLWGGHGASGPVATVQRGTLGLAAEEGLPENPDEGKLVEWTASGGPAAETDTEAAEPFVDLPAPRDDPAAWAVTGVLYVAGGDDGSGPQPQLYWATPTADGAISEWKHLDVSDLPAPLSGGAPIVNGPNAIIIGGTTPDGVIATSIRGNIAPQAPFFQLGVLGAVVPGLKIEGEIGQQLGYLNAAGVGTVNFIIIILIGIAFAHKERTRQILGRLFRRRGA
jgi:Kelch motif